MNFTLTDLPSPRAFRTSDPTAFAHWLANKGYCSIEAHGQHETARLYKDSAICIIYRSGAVVCAGANWQRLSAGLARYTTAVPLFA